MWVEREESWECKIAPPSGNRIILWADGSSLCVGWHFPVTPSRVMLCDVCDWLLPRPWEATEPRGRLLLACSIMGIIYFSSVCSFLPLPLSWPSQSFLVSPVLPLLLFLSIWPSGVYFQLEEDALVFLCETTPPPPLLTGDSWGVTLNHGFSLLTLTVSIPAPFTGTQR